MRRAAVAVAVVSVVLVSACSTGTAEGPATTTAATVPATGAVDKFWDRLAALDAGIASTTDARVQAAVAACMDDLGFDYVPTSAVGGTARPGVPASTRDWATEEFAAQWGYGVATDPMGLYAAGTTVRNPNSDYVATLSPGAQQEYAAALYGSHASQQGMTLEEVAAAAADRVADTWEQRGCTGAAEHDVAGDGGTDSVFTLAEDVMYMNQAVTRDPRLASANAAWSDCMADAGFVGLDDVDAAHASVQGELDRLWSAEWDALPAESTQGLDVDEVSQLVAKKVQPLLVDKEVATAVADYACRASVGYAEAARTVADEYQAAFYAEHQSEFDAIWQAATERSADVAKP